MDVQDFYQLLLAPVVSEFGPLDTRSLSAIVGFDVGGPINLLTVGRDRGDAFVTYITCELAGREDQLPSEAGRYDLLITCDDESWAREMLTNVGWMTTEARFSHGNTLDISPWVGRKARIQGLAFEFFSQSSIANEPYCMIRLHGLSRSELEMAKALGVETILERHKKDGTYPRTRVR
jgi:hypothetical protein